MRLKLPKISLSRKNILIIVGAVLAGLMVAYAAYSLLSWRSYEQTVGSSVDSAEADLDRALGRSVGDQLTVKDKRLSLTDKTESLKTDLDGLCQFPALTGWQVALGPVRQITDDCYQQVYGLKNRLSRLDMSMQLLNAEAELASLIEAAIQGSAQAAKDDSKWSQAGESWQQAADKTSDLDGGAGFETVKVAAEQRLTGVAEAWQALTEAHKDKDEAAFKSAKADLAKAYDKLAELDKLSSQALADQL